jgi:DNA-binding CsgD family transcriptional regulator
MSTLRPDEFFGETVAAIYEAAAIPELWPKVLDHLALLSGSLGGILLVADANNDVRYAASDSLIPLMSAFTQGGWMARNTRAARLASKKHPGFVLDSDLYTRDEMDSDPLYREVLRPYGGGWAIGTMVPVPSGDLLVFNIERAFEKGPVPREMIGTLDLLRPHLARAALLSARLHLERARTTVEAFSRLGLPAAALQKGGVVLATNSLIEDLNEVFRFAARDRLRLWNTAANELLEQALAHIDPAVDDGIVRSIPVPATEAHPALIIHLVPVKGAARDVFSGALVILVVTIVKPGSAPSNELLTSLFDLTLAEARLAGLVGSGLAPREAAKKLGIAEETARTVLKRVFSKTGVSRQSELVALLTKLVLR